MADDCCFDQDTPITPATRLHRLLVKAGVPHDYYEDDLAWLDDDDGRLEKILKPFLDQIPEPVYERLLSEVEPE